MTPETPTPMVGTGPVTYEDVLPHVVPGEKTNSSKIRGILGRGSLATIQKHLDQIRKQQTPVLPGTQAPPPPLPKDVMEAVWSSVWSAAQAMTHGRSERLSAQRDTALDLIDTQTSDIAALTADVDGLLEKITLAEGNAVVLAAKAEADLAAAMKTAAEATEALEQMAAAKTKVEADAAQVAVQAAAEAAKALEQLRLAKEKVEMDAAHAAELATRDAKIAENTMQTTINRLNDQIGDLKGLLIVRTAPAANQGSLQEMENKAR